MAFSSLSMSELSYLLIVILAPILPVISVNSNNLAVPTIVSDFRCMLVVIFVQRGSITILNRIARSILPTRALADVVAIELWPNAALKKSHLGYRSRCSFHVT